MNVLVASIHGKRTSYSSFEMSLDKMVYWTAATTGKLVHKHRSVAGNPAEARNLAVQALLESDCESIMFMDDDHVLPSDQLLRLATLLDQGPYAIVAPLICKTDPPFQTVAWQRDEVYALHPFIPWGNPGIVDVDEIGTGVVMVRREVFTTLKGPWFQVGQIPGHPEKLMEDVYFSREARKAGFRIGLDCGQTAGHTALFTVWLDPVNDCVILAGGEGHKMAIPAALFANMPKPQPGSVGM